MKIFVGKLSYSTTNESLSNFFAAYGPVISAKVITDAMDGRSRGFGFVELDDQNGEDAISALNGKTLDGREVVVSEARPQENRGGGSRAPRGDFRGGRDSDQRRFRH
jgi:RNA recognition motif-containing protein